jgi:T5orf172 domain
MPSNGLRSERDHDRTACSAPSCSTPTFPGAPWPVCPTHLREVYEFAHAVVELRAPARALLPDTRPTPRRDPETGWVYFIRKGDRVKIGWTDYPDGRFKQLQPDEVLAVVHGNRATERMAHAAFATLRIEGEWFRAEPSLVDYARHIGASYARSTG